MFVNRVWMRAVLVIKIELDGCILFECNYNIWTFEIIGTFYEKELQKTNQKEFSIEKVIKTKGDKLYVKSKGWDDSFNSWIDKNDSV